MGGEKGGRRTKTTRNLWYNYERRGGPQMFASFYDEILSIGEEALLKCNSKVSNLMGTNYKAFFHATNYQSSQSINKNGIKLNWTNPFIFYHFNITPY